MAKHQLGPPRIAAQPGSRLGLVVVVPCYDEPDLISTLEGLYACEAPECDVEIIVVVNGSEADVPPVHARNAQTLALARGWISARAEALRAKALAIHLLDFPDLPRRRAGVGMARKLGMDEAVARFHAAGNGGGIIVCLDADCRCDPNYLQALEAHFGRHPRTPGCAVYFEHPISEALGPRMRRGIVCYELYLRYYVQGLRLSGFPYAFHTVGSCMAVRNEIYQKQGGMNRRQAGEDFYFLEKIIRLGGFTELCETRVLPAPRVSTRVPFGTGRAMNEWRGQSDETFRTFAPQGFRDLAQFVARVEGWSKMGSKSGALLAGLPEPIVAFLRTEGFDGHFEEIRANSATPRTFRRRFFHWFSAFLAFKYLRWATDHRHGTLCIEEAAATVLRWRDIDPGELDARALLEVYRRIDREGRFEVAGL